MRAMSSIVWWVAPSSPRVIPAIDAAGHKLCKGADDRNFSGDCKAGGSANHVGFRDAALDEPLRELCSKGIHLEGALEVCGESHNIFIGLSGL